MYADDAMKALVGKTIASVVVSAHNNTSIADSDTVQGSAYVITCTDGYTVDIGIDYDDVDVYVEVLHG